jgi:hypothetical protein
MSLSERIVGHYRQVVEHSRVGHSIFYGVIAFITIFAIDLVWHYGARWDWIWERVTRDIVEATAVAIIAGHLFHLREERILRRHREVKYLNHHVRNALSLITVAQQTLTEEQAIAVRKASNRICSVLEQLSRGEEVSIDEEEPDKYNHGR